MDSLQNRVAIVTGAASGIGRALSEALARRGVVVVVADINATGAESVAATIRQSGGRAEAARVDVADEAQVEQLVHEAATKHGHLDYMFNNAGIAAVGEFRDANIADFRRIVDVNFFGVVQGTLSAYRVMLRQGSGHIVNLASTAALIPGPILSAYGATKAAIIAFSMTVRMEAAASEVKVSTACPGLVRTNMGDANLYWNVRKEDHLAQLPWRWMIEPDQAAKAILRGVARNEEMIVFPFSARVAWWVQRAFPSAFIPLFRSMLKRYRAIRIRP